VTQSQAVSRDSVETVVNDVFAAPEYDWSEVRDPFAWIRKWYYELVDWFAALHQEHPITYWILLAVMLVLLTAILLHFSYLIYRALRPQQAPPEHATGRRRVVRDAAWYLQEAHRLEDAGNLLGSLVMRFGSLVMELDRRNIVKFDPSKTPIEYVREATVPNEGRDLFRLIVAGVYRHAYGGEPVTRDGLREFDRMVGELVAAHVP
jgi:Domain of unknown function (DUF4129)